MKPDEQAIMLANAAAAIMAAAKHVLLGQEDQANESIKGSRELLSFLAEMRRPIGAGA